MSSVDTRASPFGRVISFSRLCLCAEIIHSEPPWYRRSLIFGLYVDPFFVGIRWLWNFFVGTLELVFETSGGFDVIVIAGKVSVHNIISDAV